jgi:hypothetical protein
MQSEISISKRQKTPRARAQPLTTLDKEEEIHYEKLYKKKDEYEAKRQERLQKLVSEITF